MMLAAWAIAWIMHSADKPPAWWIPPALICLAFVFCVEIAGEIVFMAEIAYRTLDRVTDATLILLRLKKKV